LSIDDINYQNAPFPVREDLLLSHQRAWQRLAAPGTWLTGEQRVAVAQETRQAGHCRLCKKVSERPESDDSIPRHEPGTTLDQTWVEVVHRVRFDASRLSSAWLNSQLESGLMVAEYVEIVGVVATVIAIDSFTDALGMGRHLLPEAERGEPASVMPPGAKPGLGWVPTVAPEDVGDGEQDLYDGLSGANIHRALSLVPAEVWGLFDLDAAMYLPDAALRDYGKEYRAVTHPQIELLAARVSALNRCYY
jgi:hypothetical protein